MTRQLGGSLSVGFPLMLERLPVTGFGNRSSHFQGQYLQSIDFLACS